MSRYEIVRFAPYLNGTRFRHQGGTILEYFIDPTTLPSPTPCFQIDLKAVEKIFESDELSNSANFDTTVSQKKCIPFLFLHMHFGSGMECMETN